MSSRVNEVNGENLQDPPPNQKSWLRQCPHLCIDRSESERIAVELGLDLETFSLDFCLETEI